MIRTFASLPPSFLDPAVYPYFDIYSSGHSAAAENDRQLEVGSITLRSSYPMFNICKNLYLSLLEKGFTVSFADPPVYPFFDIYNEGSCSMMVPSELEGRSATRQVRVRRARKTHQELYDAVMSRLNSATTSHQQLRRARKTHEELRTELTTQKGQLDVLRIDTTPTGRKLPVRTERSPPDSRNITTAFEASLSVKPSEIRRAGSLNRGLQSLAGNAAAVGQPLRRFASISDQSMSSHSRHNSTSRSPSIVR